MNQIPSININNNPNYDYNNNISNNNYTNNNTHEKNTHSGNMYSYREDSINEPPKESNAIRRSLGVGLNPNTNPPYTHDISRTIPQKQLEPFPESFHKMSDDNRNRNLFGQSSEMRIPPPKSVNVLNRIQEANEERPNPLYGRHDINHNINNNNDDYFYLFTYITIAIFHVILITLIGLFFEFKINNDDILKFNHIFIFFKDIHVFIFIGFGMLYSVLRDQQWTSIFLVLVIGVISIEFSFFYYYLWANTFSPEDGGGWRKINIDFQILSTIEYTAASSLITLGALLGKLSLIQYFFIAIFETFFSSLNYFLCYEKLKIIDNGGSLTIHFFGAIFGLAASCILFCNESDFMRINNNPHITSNYYSNLFALIGTIFLFLFFPSFNVANIQMQDFKHYYDWKGLGYISENLRYRGIINTYLSMIGSVLAAFIVPPLFYRGKLKMERILHASYVGGIIIGGSCTICSSAWSSIVIGFIGSTISIIFLWKIKDLLHSIRFEDTIGVLELFAIPGLLGGVVTCIFLGNFSNENAWKNEAMTAIFGSNRNKASVQAGLQVSGIFVTLGIALFSGLITGLLAKLMLCSRNEKYFVDSQFFVEEERVDFPEYKFQDERENQLNSSGNKLDYEGKEININNNKNDENNIYNINNNYNNNDNNNDNNNNNIQEDNDDNNAV